jgi:phytanoyl-CoA hydroxylase
VAQEVWFDEVQPGEYAPDLYRCERVASGVGSWAEVDAEALDRFAREGFLVVERAYPREMVAAALQALLDLVAGSDPSFRGVQYEAGARGRLEGLAPEQRLDLVRKFWMFVGHDARLRAMAEYPPLLDALQRIMGDRPVLFQDQAMCKPPRVGREKPWHQDNAYFNLDPGTCVVGAWIALDPATPENGCMHVIPGSHLQGPVVHFRRRDWQICDAHVAVEQDVVVPLPPGGCLLFHGLLHHGTPANRSPERRRALQFHYRPAGAREIRPEERMAVFGSEGKDVSC